MRSTWPKQLSRLTLKGATQLGEGTKRHVLARTFDSVEGRATHPPESVLALLESAQLSPKTSQRVFILSQVNG